MRTIGFLAAALVLTVTACGGSGMRPWTPPSSRDKHDDPASVRPGYCNGGVPFWAPLRAPEIEALRGLERAKAGDPHALLALALFASGDHRDAASYRAFQDNVDRFVAEIRPKVDAAADDWHKGYELHRAMHRVYFRSQRTELANYELNQSRVTRIFETGHYNCMSSAMLFSVLASSFAMPVRGAEVPTHAFIELGQQGAKVFEVETTSDTGFDLVHDERFYRESAANWSSSRGLAPVTIEQYRHRRMLLPYQLMALGLRNQGTYETEKDRNRLLEAAAFVDLERNDMQRDRLSLWVQEANALHDDEASRTTVKLFDCVRPAITEIATKWASDATTMELVAWSDWYYADALGVVKRSEEAVAIADAALDRVNPSWKDGAALLQNYVNVINDRMLELMTAKDFSTAVTVPSKHLDACRRDPSCGSNLEIVWLNWSAEHQSAGDWQAARQALNDCLTQLPGDKQCDAALKDLESRHRF